MVEYHGKLMSFLKEGRTKKKMLIVHGLAYVKINYLQYEPRFVSVFGMVSKVDKTLWQFCLCVVQTYSKQMYSKRTL